MASEHSTWVGHPNELNAAHAIRHARSLGINFFDTAPAYGFGRSERLLGRALAADLRTEPSGPAGLTESPIMSAQTPSEVLPWHGQGNVGVRVPPEQSPITRRSSP